jgi:hypothetical protein
VTEPPRVPNALRFAVDAEEPPLAYPDDPYPDDPWPAPAHAERLAVEVDGLGLTATLVLPMDEARSWAAALFAAVSVAYREATGDPHALSDEELAALPPADSYAPGPGLLVEGEGAAPARVRFHIALDVEAAVVDTAAWRAAFVEVLYDRFGLGLAGLAVSAGEPLAGRLA